MIEVSLSENGKGFFITKREDDPLLTQRQMFLTVEEFAEVIKQGVGFVTTVAEAIRTRDVQQGKTE